MFEISYLPPKLHEPQTLSAFINLTSELTRCNNEQKGQIAALSHLVESLRYQLDRSVAHETVMRMNQLALLSKLGDVRHEYDEIVTAVTGWSDQLQDLRNIQVYKIASCESSVKELLESERIETSKRQVVIDKLKTLLKPHI